MKHLFLILLAIAIIVTGIFLPYTHGDYDNFVAAPSHIFQFGSFTALLFVPVGLIWLILNITGRQNNEPRRYPAYLRRTAGFIWIFVLLASALGAFVANSRFLAIIILCVAIFAFIIRKKLPVLHISDTSIPCYFICIPLTIVCIRLILLEKMADNATSHAIKQSEQLIRDIESYKIKNGHYPVSLLSTIDDYKPQISCIPRFHYEMKGDAYNIYFEQLSTAIGTQEIVMYNKLDEQEMTVHNQDLLRIPYNNILHGHHKVEQLQYEHWKIFYFD